MTIEPWPAFAPQSVRCTDGSDGSLAVESGIDLQPGPDTLIDRLASWVARDPDRILLAERHGDLWVKKTYVEVWHRTTDLARRLLSLGLSVERPLMVVAPNSIAHAEIVLAAMRIGVPAAIVSPALAAAGPTDRLRHAIDLLTPGAVYVEGAAAARAAAALAPDIVLLGGDDAPGAADPSALEPASDVAFSAAQAGVGAETIAKFLFTSGSTGAARAVPNTHRMMVSNMDGLALTWPFLKDRPPRMLDWLPWSHTFGGNCCFNLALAFGGTFHIDNGKPMPALIGETVRNLGEVLPSVYFNVPAGYAALLPFLEADEALTRRFLGGLDFLFNAGAAMPSSTRERLEAVANVAGVSLRIVGGWGSTETAPFSTVIHFPTRDAASIGLPMPGVAVKMVPQGTQQELRVRGPNVTRGYWRGDSADMFDAEGFYCIGDAGRLADPDRPEEGILYDGRLAENFKLSSGTWVNVGAVRLAVVAATAPLIADAVITGHDGEDLGALLFPDLARCRARLDASPAIDDADLCAHPDLQAAIAAALAEHNAQAGGTSRRIARFALMSEPLRPDAGEITDKGYVNQRLVLSRRAEAVRALETEGHRVPPQSLAPKSLSESLS